MAKNCGHKVPCGCGDGSLSTQPPCNASGTCAGEQCSELFCENCIAHCDDDIYVYAGATIGNIEVNKGDRWNVIVQRLLIASANGKVPDAAVGLHVKSKTSSSVTLRFFGNSAVTYDCELEDQDTSVVTYLTPSHVGDGWHEVTFTGLITNALPFTHQALVTGSGTTSVILKFNII